ncbi:MAG: hypothetical protein ACAI35_22335 [Candidatus Methylacidiphilales bacterium]
MKRILSFCLATMLSVGATSLHADPVTIHLAPSSDTAPLNRELLGSQYNFFSTPIRNRIKSEALIRNWQAMPVKVMRYPGGTWGDHYVWDNPAGSYFAAGDVNSIVTPQEFITNCRAVGAEPIFQVNTNIRGDNHKDLINPTKIEDIRTGAERAARWVREANKRKGWNVKYWEIGNEVWIWLKPEEYALYVVEYSKAMRAVDPTIKIIACGLAGNTGIFHPNWLKFPDDPNWSRPDVQNNAEEWNQALFDKALGSFDYVAPHIYIESGDGKMTARERFDKSNAMILDNEKLGGQAVWGQKFQGKARIALTEWACNFRQSVPVLRNTNELESHYYYSLGNGLNTGLFFGKVLEVRTIDMAILHALDDLQTLWYWPKKELAKDGPLDHPIYLAMKIWGGHLGKTPMQVDARNIPNVEFSGKARPSLYTYASEDASNVYMVAINLNADKELDLDIARDPKWSSSPAALTWMKGAALEDTNFSAWNGAAPLKIMLTTDSVPVTGENIRIKMPLYSMVGIIIKKQTAQANAH